jgi:hypothetical protein
MIIKQNKHKQTKPATPPPIYHFVFEPVSGELVELPDEFAGGPPKAPGVFPVVTDGVPAGPGVLIVFAILHVCRTGEFWARP